MEYSRLGVVLGIVGIPLYLWILLYVLWTQSIVFDVGGFVLLVQFVVAPLFFSIPWILFLYLSRDRLADAIKQMKETSTVVPVRWRFFYGFNTLVIVFFFVIPYLSPVLAVIGGVILAGRVYFAAESIRKKRTAIKGLFLSLLLIVLVGLPIILLIRFFTGYAILFSKIWEFWGQLDVHIYDFSLCIGDALAFGSLFWFIYAGAAEFEFQTYGMYVSRPPAKLIKLFEAILFVVFVYVAFPEIPFLQIPLANNPTLFSWINIVCLAIVAVIFLISFFKGLKKTGGTSSALGLIFLIAFLSVEIIYRGNPMSNLPTYALFGASGLFLLMFFLDYRRVGSR